MARKLLMILLGVGAVAGFGSGLARLWHGPGRHFDRHAELERRVADACTESALRVYKDRAGKGEPAP